MTEAIRDSAGQSVDPPVSSVLTFLIADVRGYTAFSFEHGDEAAARLAARFAEVTERVVRARGGEVLELRGDEALVVFSSARSAVRAAIDLQARFAEESSPSLPLNVGIGLDAGDAVPVKGGYRGRALNVAARLCSLSDPGDILVSETIVHLVGRTEGLSYAERGTVQLKGVPEPVLVIQVLAEGAPQPPPLLVAHVPTSHPNNLPVAPTPFIGRELEIEEVTSLLHRPAVRLITLTGAGGTGKTRLAEEVAAGVLDDFPDGVYLISLAVIRDPELVQSTIAQSLGLTEESGKSVTEVLHDHLRERRMLLVLDNFEHVRSAAPFVADLLNACRELKVLVTSRAVLNVYGEYVYDVPSLSVPDSRDAADLDRLLSFEAVRLFVERAQAAKATFSITPENAGAIAEICRRLDGLPLAIELAAARIRILPPSALLGRLSHRLRVLTGGARGLPERQQTLRGTIDWSYGLLHDFEPILFARLAAFAGGCTLEAIEAVCGDGDVDILDSVTALVENSLLRQEGEDEPRFVMLETVREYAVDVLDSQTDAQTVRGRLADYCLALSLEADSGMRGAEQGAWMARLDAEHDNIRAALAWAAERGEGETGLRIGVALWRFWWSRGYLSEGRRWLETFLPVADGVEPSVRATALSGLANLIWSQGDLDRAESLHREVLEIRRDLGDTAGMAAPLNNLGVVAETRGDFAAAARWYEQGLEALQQSGDSWIRAMLLGNLGGVLGNMGNHERATELAKESLGLLRRLGDRASQGRVLNNLASLALTREAYGEAAQLQRESLTLNRELRHYENMAFSLEGAAKILVAADRADDAARLFGAAGALRQRIGQPVPTHELAEQRSFIDRARARLGDASYDAIWSEGQTLTAEQAEDYAQQALSF